MPTHGKDSCRIVTHLLSGCPTIRSEDSTCRVYPAIIIDFHRHRLCDSCGKSI